MKNLLAILLVGCKCTGCPKKMSRPYLVIWYVNDNLIYVYLHRLPHVVLATFSLLVLNLLTATFFSYCSLSLT